MNLNNELDVNFQKKGEKDLSFFINHNITKENIKEYKNKEKSLCHVSEKDEGNIYTDKNKNVVGYYSINPTSGFITSLFISDKYRGYGLGKQLLYKAINDGGCNLSVSKNNKLAIDLYKKNGFKKNKETDKMIFMTRKLLKEDVDNILGIIKQGDLNYISSLDKDKIKLISESVDFLLKTRSYEYDNIKLVKIREFIHNSNLLQEKSLDFKPNIKLDIDSDGNILLTKRESANYNTIFNNSHILLKSYEKVGNIEGMKYELCKLYMIVSIINEKYIHSKSIFTSKEKKKQMIQLKSFIMNDFYKYLNIILEKENDFNFNAYFSNTQFGIETYKINNTVLKGIKQIIF